MSEVEYEFTYERRAFIFLPGEQHSTDDIVTPPLICLIRSENEGYINRQFAHFQHARATLMARSNQNELKAD